MPTLFTGGSVRFAIIPFADGARFVTERTQGHLTMVAMSGVAFTNDVFAACIAGNVFGAKVLLTDRTGRATGRTEALLAFGARLDGQGPTMATWTFDQTVVTIRCIVNGLIKTGADDALAGGTTDQTILTEALPAGATDAHFGTILVAAGAAQRTVTTQINRLAGRDAHLINT